MFYQKNNYQKELLRLKDWNIHHQTVSLKKQIGVAKDQLKFLKDEMNAINNNNRKDDIN